MQNPLAATVVEDSDTIIFYFKAKTNSEICNLLLAISTHSEVVFPFILGQPRTQLTLLSDGSLQTIYIKQWQNLVCEEVSAQEWFLLA